jgi:hypothetical protein
MSSTQSALFVGTSSEVGRYFHLRVVPSDASLGVKLINCDGAATNDPTMQFYPGYALVGGFMDDCAYRQILRPGDLIIAVNGRGFRRFAYHKDDEVEDAALGNTVENTTETTTTATTPATPIVELDHVVVPPSDTGAAYQQFMEKLKAVKLAGGDPPLTLTLIRFDWDARAFAWRRFLAARNQNVMEALRLHQTHVAWRAATFPMDISSPGIQAIFSTKTVAQIDSGNVRAVYVNYGRLLKLLEPTGTIDMVDVRNAFIVVTEKMLAAGNDPRHPTITQLIDVSGVSYTNFRTDVLKDLYNTFEPNYPETLYKMIVYPVSAVMVRTCLVFCN